MTGMTAVLGAVATLGTWAAVAVGGLAAGRLLTALVGRIVDAPEDRDPWVHRGIEAAAVASALGLWWWEVGRLGQLPPTAGPSAEVPWRCVAHLVLFALLAAASWVDIRHRVIPDCITVPGVLAGLAWMAIQPAALLPIVHEVPRPYAVPLRVPDVLTAWGGLCAVELPALGAAWPSPAGLACGLAIFLVWWRGCTAPFLEPDPRRHRLVDLLAEPRNLVLGGGIAGVVAAWRIGGVHWAGLLTSLVGLAVAAGVVWLTRAGASWAVGREAMGLGDVTLMAMVGAWLGWQACVLACFGGVFIGLGHGLGQMIRHREAELPFGPSLCLATAAVVVLWRPCWERVGELFAHPLDMAALVAAVIVLTAVGLVLWRRVRGLLFG